MATVTTLADSEHVIDIDPTALSAEQLDPVESNGMPSAIRKLVVNTDPKMSVIPNFLSEAECDYLISLVEGNWFPSLVGQQSNKDPATGEIGNSKSKTRTSWSSMLRYSQSAIVDRIEHRAALVAGLPVENLERLNMVRYSPGEHFGEHHDGKFRERTVFMYLNDVPGGGGETFFRHLGFRFIPRRGAAVVWSNAAPDGTEDSRMVHQGLPPKSVVKFGVNCFFRFEPLRQVLQPRVQTPLQDLTVVDVRGLGQAAETEDALKTFRLGTETPITVAPKLLNDGEVADLLVEAMERRNGDEAPSHSFHTAGGTVRVLRRGGSLAARTAEIRCCVLAKLSHEYFASLRVVHACTEVGMCNRGCGPKSCYIALCNDDVSFPHFGVRLRMRRGDGVSWPNIVLDSGEQVEEVRNVRVHHRWSDDPQEAGDGPAVGLDAYFNSTIKLSGDASFGTTGTT